MQELFLTQPVTSPCLGKDLATAHRFADIGQFIFFFHLSDLAGLQVQLWQLVGCIGEGEKKKGNKKNPLLGNWQQFSSQLQETSKIQAVNYLVL